MEKKMENEMETGIIGFLGCLLYTPSPNPWVSRICSRDVRV